jgi:hypothetical protein
MKTKIKFLAILLALIVSSVIFARQLSAQQSDVSFQVFYDQLSPYGQWVDYPNYGYVWMPNAGPDFVPYSTKGHWILTDYGWTWLSDYDWGWAPFHYGRWDFDNAYGWFWVPDNEWGPAWVSWRRADGYYGWEPMQPGISVSLSFGREYDSHNDHWIFVRDRYIDRSDMNRFYANRIDHDKIIRNSTVIHNTYIDNGRHSTYVSGPAREDVQKVTNRKVSPVTIQENNKPGQEMNNGQLRIYRPQVIKNNGTQQKPAPSRITNLKDVKQTPERNSANQPRNANQPGNSKQVQQQNAVNQRNAATQRKAANQQSAATQQNAANQRNAASQQDAVNQQNAVNRRNAANQQNAAAQKSAATQQNAANQKNQVQKVQEPQNTKKGIAARIFGKKTKTTVKTKEQQDNNNKKN